MSYTKGRKFTDEELLAEARKYKTKRELKAMDNSLLSIATRRGIPWSKLFEHMVDIPFSIPQLMCKLILETVLQEKCLYDTRQIIKPYEIDIYFPKYKLAFEYSGDYWHQQPDAIKRDKIKKERCNQEGITLIVLNMRSRRWEEDVKQQLMEHLDTINKITNKKIVLEDVLKIDCKNIYKNLPAIVDLDHVREKMKECKNLREFVHKFKREYRYLINSSQLHVLHPLKEKIRWPDSVEDLLKLCLKIPTYNEFVKNYSTLYNKCIKIGILNEATRHMKKTNNIFRSYSDKELTAMVPVTAKNITHFKRHNGALYRELYKRNLLKQTGLPDTRKKKQHFAKNQNYFNLNVAPLLENGLSLHEIHVKGLLPFGRSLLGDLIRLFGTDEHKQKAIENKIKNYKNKKMKVE